MPHRRWSCPCLLPDWHFFSISTARWHPLRNDRISPGFLFLPVAPCWLCSAAVLPSLRSAAGRLFRYGDCYFLFIFRWEVRMVRRSAWRAGAVSSYRAPSLQACEPCCNRKSTNSRAYGWNVNLLRMPCIGARRHSIGRTSQVWHGRRYPWRLDGVLWKGTASTNFARRAAIRARP